MRNIIDEFIASRCILCAVIVIVIVIIVIVIVIVIIIVTHINDLGPHPPHFDTTVHSAVNNSA